MNMANLVILESPTKAHTVKGFLGSGYKVVACRGHVRDLPKSKLGVDLETFEPSYINIRGKGELIDQLRKDAKAAGKVYLATDPDREGEAIAWHLAEVLQIPEQKVCRVTFNEITKTAVKAGIKAPRAVDMSLVDSQQSRRILDRVVGYRISPFLWKKVRSGLSAGRVQSVVTRMIVDRELEIRAFQAEEYWTLTASLKAASSTKAFEAKFYGTEKKAVAVKNEAQMQEILEELKEKDYTIKSIKKGTKRQSPAAPFTTSTLQQEASRKLSFQSSRTMRVAQELYEGVNIPGEGEVGLITYMRTDSLRISAEIQQQALAYIGQQYGSEYVPATPRVYKTRAGAQDAHEAIRPTSLAFVPTAIRKHLTADQFRLYKLIWDRFVASQMKDAQIDTVSADIAAGKYIFRSSGNTVKFPGFLAVYEEGRDEEKEKESKLPSLTEGETLLLKKLVNEQKFTQPPSRYTEASMIKTMEENGIGRPSTYTPTISTILERGYVERDGKQLRPTPLGEVTTQLMKESFAEIVDYDFTAHMEQSLDDIASGEKHGNEFLKSFWKDFRVTLEKAEQTLAEGRVKVPDVESDQVCEICGRKMVVKNGRYGKFLACPGYPECKNTRPMESNKSVETDLVCEVCGKPMVLKSGRYGKFYACSGYPECKNIRQMTRETAALCPKCGGKILAKRSRNGKTYYGCEKHPTCDFMTWSVPTEQVCPTCGKSIFVKSRVKKLGVCLACGHEEALKENESGQE